MLTLADRFTLARIVLAPLIVAAYLLLPVQWMLCFWTAGWLCGLAEYTDFVDGRVARARGEVSDFGKLADPFCDVFYRIAVFLVLLLPAGGVGYAVAAVDGGRVERFGNSYDIVAADGIHQLVFAVGFTADGAAILGAGLMPWLPVLLMTLREIVAGALRSMTATKGLVLAARASGKLKAWVQGVTLITLLGLPACWWVRAQWHLEAAFWASWACAALSVYSILEYIWVNRGTLRQLVERRRVEPS
ncbi:MAG TPA: CDP-alcohol phosphatidyltransferase family protein [Planctomycetota bacterium]|nr:CDP-alcohol phosphatidyltransferase family protein [Planctomycetota bacterium]